MSVNLKFSQYLVIGTALFGLFFGAGNFIFPLALGQQSGTNYWIAIGGFLISGIGLPFLGVLATGYCNGENIQKLAARICPIYGAIFVITLYLIIGPLFALPRTATVSYEIRLSSFVSENHQALGLVIYSIFFFSCALYFSLNPSKVVFWIGKVLTPIFLLFTVIVILLSIFLPMGHFQESHAPYDTHALSQGILDGYNTMDALASLACGYIVVNAIKNYGVSDPKQIIVITTKAGLLGVTLMAIIYLAIGYIGATSIETIGLYGTTEGSKILGNVVQHYLGGYGSIFLAILIFFTCLTTAIGLISACASCFSYYLPKISYKKFTVIVSIAAACIANIGLSNIINFALPVLRLICPLTVSFILLIFVARDKIVYVITTIFTFVASLFDMVDMAIKVFNIDIHNSFVVLDILALHHYFPLYEYGMGWLLPMFIGLLIGMGINKLHNKKQVNA